MTADAYAHCATLTRDQWAWEFLRRNPDYQRDYRAFIAIWRALEADYGAPPNRDFSKWKRDPRAYGPLPGDAELAAPGGELCTVDDDRVLLECWMGAKWGFHKFPLDPRLSPGSRLRPRPPPAAPARGRQAAPGQPRRRTAPIRPARSAERRQRTRPLGTLAAPAGCAGRERDARGDGGKWLVR
jgi:hypothetical protein